MRLVHRDALLKYEDKLPLWPLTKLRNYLGRFISVSFHSFLLLVPLSYFTLEKGKKGKKKNKSKQAKASLAGYLNVESAAEKTLALLLTQYFYPVITACGRQNNNSSGKRD